MEKEQNVIPVNLDFNAKIHNRFDIEVCDAKTGKLKQKAQAFNVICNALWTRLFSGNTYFNYIIYGSGTGTPAATDTALFNKIAGREYDYNYGTYNTYSSQYAIAYNAGDIVVAATRRLTIDTETSNGKTITEVGIGYDATHIVTHAMLQDMNGNPISITKTNTDIIYIYATIYVHGHAYTQTKDITIVDYDFDKNIIWSNIINTAAGMSTLSNDIILDKGNIFWNSNNGESNSTGYYKSASVSRDSSTKTFTHSTRCLASEANFSRGILSIYYCSGIILDVRKTFNINTYAITGESLGTGDSSTTNFNTKFPINSNAKIYVDGVEQSSGITVNTGVDKEFYKLRKFYNTQRNLIVPARNLFNSNATYKTCTFCVENDENIVFTGLFFKKINTYWTYYQVYGSDDFNTWTLLANGSTGSTSNTTVSFQTQTNYKYYKFNFPSTANATFSQIYLISPNDKTYDVIFDTPPASGSVITIDYVPDCIPKDSNHVLDLTLSITLGEYSGN